jgi:hypothetical protein
VKAGAYCYIDKVPTCAQEMTENRVRAGSLHSELRAVELRQFVGRGDETGFVNEDIDISPSLPRGFGYTWVNSFTDPTPYTHYHPANGLVWVNEGQPLSRRVMGA